jgi:hypothetical protein
VFLLEQFGWRVSLQCYGVAVLLGTAGAAAMRDVSAAVP